MQAGNTLSGITERFYGQDADWRSLYAANEVEDQQPEHDLRRRGTPPAPAPAGPRGRGGPAVSFRGQHAHDGVHPPARRVRARRASGAASASQPSAATTTNLSGTLSCSGLEALWVEAGGSTAAEVTAASIAMAESGGNQFATGTVGERGYWQINPVNGSLSTYDPYGNARAAVIMSGNGTNWSPWTTYTSGAYAGRC